MPYSITTKDGITIQNIPDDIEPDSDILRKRVADIRGKQDVDSSGGPDDNIASPDLGVPSPQQQPSFAGSGIIEPAAALISGAIAEPLAGLAGIASSAGRAIGLDVPTGGEAVEATREALTFQPRTESGQESIQAVGEALAPVGEALSGAEDFLGDKTFEITGSPALAAAAKTIPTALGEILGVAFGKGAVKASQRTRRAAAQGKITRELSDAVPTIDQLKDASRSVYKEIDDAGITLKSGAFSDLTSRLEKAVSKGGFDKDITPKTAKALNRFQELRGADVPLSEVDNLRTVAQNAAKSIEPAESALGSKMIDTIDEFLDKSGSRALQGDPSAVAKLGKKYKTARDLWGRARRSELIEESFEKARLQASGFENGIRTQFRQILNNKKKKRFFNKPEQAAMRRVVEGTKGENFAKLVGRLGFSEGGATNILGGAAGVGAGAAIGGPVGAVMVPAIGQVSRKLAQRMTAKNAEFADQVIRSGSNARKITEAYMNNTPKPQRSAQELSELLMSKDIDLSNLPSTDLASQAAELATQRKAQLTSALAAGQTEEGQ